MERAVLRDERFLDILGKLVGLGKQLQNAPDAGLIPKESLAVDVVVQALEPHLRSGFIEGERLAADGHGDRESLVLTIRGTGDGALGFVGAHFDVVPADREAEGWERDPFALHVGTDGTLYGRGVTDCLGHVAVLTDLLAQMAESKWRPRRTLKVVLIANEEDAPLPEVGLDFVVAKGRLRTLKGQPVYWLDSADFGPTVGTAGMAMWELDVEGVGGHSGMPQNCVNALEIAMATSLALGDWFRRRFPAHPQEAIYRFLSPSSLKATVVSGTNTKVSKIPGQVRVEGDVRLTPFYEMAEAKDAIEGFVRDLDEALRRGDAPPGFPRVKTADGKTAKITFRWKGRSMEGIACDLNSPALRALENALRTARGENGAQPFSLTGSLPLVRELQREGFDVQITGFGRSSFYHAPNEQASLNHFREGFVLLRELLKSL